MTWIQTSSGRALDLINPSPDDIDFVNDIADPLARISRYNGHINSGPFSVAQHCVIGADYLYRTTHRPELGAAFLLHDAHEAYIGDITTPVQDAIGDILGTIYAGSTNDPLSQDFGKKLFAKSVAEIKRRMDVAIHNAAGMQFPMPDSIQKVIKETDIRMLITERRHLMGPAPRSWGSFEKYDPLPLRGKISVWPWAKAADEYRRALARFIPQIFNGARGAA